MISDYLNILPEILGTIAAGGWLMSRHRRKQERENHAAELAKKDAELLATIRDSETKYTREALEIYTQQVVEPMRQQLDRNTQAIARYQGAIDCAPSCRLYPDCVILHKLRNKAKDDNPC